MAFLPAMHSMLEVTLTCADPAMAMSQIQQLGIPVFSVYGDDNGIDIYFQIYRRDFTSLKNLSDKKGYCLKLKRRYGPYWAFQSALKRPVLTVGLLFFLLVTVYLPTRVLFVSVEGNVTIPTKYILDKSQQCGITFGVSKRQVRSEKVKNALLDAIPQLQWAGVNTSGCTAVISVQERTDLKESHEDDSVSSIVACRDGVITQCTATKGNLLCKPGQAVKAGEVLISGYTDCGICIRANHAQGEIYAKTERNLSVLTPSVLAQKGQMQVTAKKYALIIGKNRINFYKDSGILDTTCDKMYSESYMTLPGGFRLPIILVTEIYTYRQSEQIQIEEPSFTEFAQAYLNQEMVSGVILSKSETISLMDGAYYMTGQYICTEMIGRIRSEEIIKPYE